MIKNPFRNPDGSKRKMADQTMLLVITIAVFFLMYIAAVVFLGSGFLKPQTFFNILNENASLIVLSCALSLSPAFRAAPKTAGKSPPPTHRADNLGGR